MTLTRAQLTEVTEALDAIPSARMKAGYRPRYNVAPTDAHPVVLPDGARPGARALDAAVWGFSPPRSDEGRPPPLVINARAETVPFKPLFREAFVQRRCLVVADGFYEWRTVAGKRMPLWFHRPDGGLVTMAGLYQQPEPGQLSFVVVTTAPNQLVTPIHDRMPAILDGSDAQGWLDRADADLLRPAAEDLLVATPVSNRVNAVTNDDPDCLVEVDHEAEAAPKPDRQLRLF